MKNLIPEMIEKAKAAKTAEELLALAKENNIAMTADEAATYFAQLNPKSGEISDDDLDNVAGGACKLNSEEGWNIPANGTRVRVLDGNRCPKCSGTVGLFYYVDTYCGALKVECEKCPKETVAYWAYRPLTLGIDYELA